MSLETVMEEQSSLIDEPTASAGDIYEAAPPQTSGGLDTISDHKAHELGVVSACGVDGGHSPPQPPPLEEMVDLITRHCILKLEEVFAIVLWVLASYLINSFRIFPRLALISPEKRCGKTTVIETVHSLAKLGLVASHVSAASLFRMTKECQPTLLIDEADTFLKNGDSQLVGLINSSHTRAGAKVIRCDGDDRVATAHSTWMPMAFGSIGDLPSTIMDRSIVVNLRRKLSHESTERLPVDVFEQQEVVRNQIEEWCEAHAEAVRETHVSPPDLGNDRAQDNWFPLFAVAQVIGGEWPERCERAYRMLTAPADPEMPTQLLMGIQGWFSRTGLTRVSSSDLVDWLCADATGPWLEYSNGRKISQAQVARLLRPYGISPTSIRFDKSVKRGYELSQFSDAFRRYLP